MDNIPRQPQQAMKVFSVEYSKCGRRPQIVSRLLCMRLKAIQTQEAVRFVGKDLYQAIGSVWWHPSYLLLVSKEQQTAAGGSI
jgi:hypothetical protein